MDPSYLVELVKALRLRGVVFAPGLTDTEVYSIETIYGFRFPPDLRAFLQYALPVSDKWVNWRDARAEKRTRERLDWPAEGICFDVEHNAFWMDEWGVKPTDLNEALAVARQHVAEAPTLIPIYSHRYLPSDPFISGNPVFSVHQTDIIYYGYDLASYLNEEFNEWDRYSNEDDRLIRVRVPNPDWAAKSPRPIRFWDDLVGGAAYEAEPP